jgi:hypothetical protein
MSLGIPPSKQAPSRVSVASERHEAPPRMVTIIAFSTVA